MRALLQSISTRQLFLGYLLAALLMGAVGVVSYRQAAQIAIAGEWSDHTLRVVGSLERIRADVRTAETSQRGYVITFQERYQADYRAATALLDRELERLDTLIADNAEQRARLAALRPVIAGRLAKLDEAAVARRTGGFEAAMRVIATGEGQRLGDEVGRRLDEMEAIEQALLARHEDEPAQSTRRAIVTLFGGTVTSVLLVGAVFFVLVLQTRERERAEARSRDVSRQLELAHAAYQQMMDHSLDVICKIDANGCFTGVSAAVTQLWGYRPEELIGRRYMDLVHPDDRDKTAQAAAAIVQGLATSNFENRYVRRDGSVVPIMWSAAWSTEHEAMFCVARDMSERKRVEMELEDARRRAEAATQARSEFLANMSHEVRTPLTGLLGMLGLVQETPMTPDQERYVGIAHSAARTLLEIVNDILDVSKIEAGRMDLEQRPFHLDQALESGLAALETTARQKRLAYSCVLERDVPLTLVGDAGRLQQILVNLVGNAVKFTADGSVRVVVSRLSDEGAVARLRFAVSDTGVGIPEHRRQAVFEPFTQADGSTTRRFGGTGLGLTIAARLARMMGGELRLDPAPPPGATFHLDVPFAVHREDAMPEPRRGRAGTHARHERALHILVAEDTESIRIYLEALLQKWGHRVTSVVTGMQAIEAVFAERPELVLMDGHMPECDGLQAARRIRARERGASRVPIIALTARAMVGDRQACLDAGMDGYLTKPIDVAALFDAVATVAGTVRASVDEAAVLEQFGGDRALLARLVPVFVDECTRLTADLDRAIAQADPAAVERLAHSLKSAIGHWSTGRAFEAARALEAAARGGRIDAGEWRVLQRELPLLRDEVSGLLAA